MKKLHLSQLCYSNGFGRTNLIKISGVSVPNNFITVNNSVIKYVATSVRSLSLSVDDDTNEFWISIASYTYIHCLTTVQQSFSKKSHGKEQHLKKKCYFVQKLLSNCKFPQASNSFTCINSQKKICKVHFLGFRCMGLCISELNMVFLITV